MARVLIVDDDPLLREFIILTLAPRGHQVGTAASGAAGIAAAERDQPDLILMDLKMAGMSGFEAIRRLKRDPATSAIRIVALTAHDTPANRDEAHQAGCEGFIAKPVDAAQLIARVEALLNRNAAPRGTKSGDEDLVRAPS